MKKQFITSLMLVALFTIIMPIQVTAAAGAGVKPGTFFYFFDTVFENVSLFFTFSHEGKVKKALGYADERLAEIEEIAETENSDVIKKVIENYESNIAFATKKFKEVESKEQVENLLILIDASTLRNQEVLSDALSKVPGEAKEAISSAIESGKRGQDEVKKQVGELKKIDEEFSAESETSEEKPTPPTLSALRPKERPTSPTEVQSDNTEVSADSLGSELLKFLNTQVLEKTRSDLNYYEKTISDLRYLIRLQKDSAHRGEQNCLAAYASRIQYAKDDADRQKTAYNESRRGFATQPGIVTNIDAQLERDLQDIEIWKDDCLAKYRVDDLLELRLNQVSGNLSSASQRFFNGSNIVSLLSDINSIKSEIFSITNALGSSLGVSGDVSLPTITSGPSSVTCTNEMSGFSCRDNFGSNIMRCTQSVAGFLDCSDSNSNNISCQPGVVPGDVRCSW